MYIYCVTHISSCLVDESLMYLIEVAIALLEDINQLIVLVYIQYVVFCICTYVNHPVLFYAYSSITFFATC